MGNLFVFFLRLSASTFHCFFIACIIYNFVILCSLVAFRPGNILDVCADFIRGCGSSTPDGSALKDGCLESGLEMGLPIPVFAQSIPTWILPGRLSLSVRPFLALASSRGRDWLRLFWLGGLDDES